MEDYLEKILEFLPETFFDKDSDDFIKYLSDAFIENSTNEKYQFAFTAFHMLNMVFIYKTKWFLFKQGNTIICTALENFRNNKNNNIDDNYKGIFGVRIDSGDLSEYANMCKKELENSGLKNAKIILTGGLNEDKIRKMVKENVKVDIFGVGDAISLPENKISLVYKMSKINNQNVMKLSNNKNKMSN